jgi:triphosphoribosyl-dephospho-CoA synthase
MSGVQAVDVSVAAQLACLLEASAPKPGNVSPGRHFADARYEDFLASAAAIGAPLAGAATRPLGATVRLAIDATARWTRSNTTLGIVLLLAPLARAALLSVDLRRGLRDVLAATTVDDARDVYAAIRRAGPGGLGTVESQDVAGEPDVTLLEAMRLAADRDGIAHEYTTGFEVTFGIGAPSLERARGDGLSWDAAVVETFLTLLAATPDTHIARRAGAAVAAEVSRRARSAQDTGGVRTEAGRRAIDELDRWLRDVRHTSPGLPPGGQTNPGTTADLTASAIFVMLLSGGWRVGPA